MNAIPVPYDAWEEALETARFLANWINGANIDVYRAPALWTGWSDANTYTATFRNRGTGGLGLEVRSSADAPVFKAKDDGITATAATVEGNATVGGTLGVTGNATLGGTLGVTGATTLSSTLGVTGNATVGGTLGVTGNLSVNTNKFVITAASGNTTVAGTLGVTGAGSFSSTLAVTDDLTVATNLLAVDVSAGAVGIGTASPDTDYLLDVNGLGICRDHLTLINAKSLRALNAAATAVDVAQVTAADILTLGNLVTQTKLQGAVGVGLGVMVAQLNGRLGFFGGTPTTRITVSGTRTGTLAQLQDVVRDLLQALDDYGLITDSTS